MFHSEATVAAMSPYIPPTARNVDFNEFGHYVTAYLMLAIIITPSFVALPHAFALPVCIHSFQEGIDDSTGSISDFLN